MRSSPGGTRFPDVRGTFHQPETTTTRPCALLVVVARFTSQRTTTPGPCAWFPTPTRKSRVLRCMAAFSFSRTGLVESGLWELSRDTLPITFHDLYCPGGQYA